MPPIPPKRIVLPPKKTKAEEKKENGRKTPAYKPVLSTRKVETYQGFEKGATYQCLKSFRYKFSQFYENEILEVVGSRKTPGLENQSLEIIFVNLQSYQKKFYTISLETINSQETFQRIYNNSNT
jgi:hypothetical protein